MRRLIPLLAALPIARAATAQVPPSDFESVELARSRACVDVIDRLETLDQRLEPLAGRSQRLLGIAEAIAIEEPSIVDVLDDSDPLEAEVKAWFANDGALAQRYLAGSDPAVLAQRSAAREAIQVTVSEALGALRAQADSVIATTGTLGEEAGNCDGAVFVRSAVLEACATQGSPVCDAARDTADQPSAFRFVDSAEILWNMQQLRPWTAPGPLAPSPDGQLGGARTVGYTRIGNLVVNLAFYPMLLERDSLATEQLERIEVVHDSLGFEATHPDLVFVPTLAVQVALPEPIGGESMYILHFGEPESAQIVWTGAAGTGTRLEGLVELGPSAVARLQAGDPFTLTAVRESEQGDNEAVFAIELTAVNQAPTTQALVGYMAQQFSSDLERLFPPGNR